MPAQVLHSKEEFDKAVRPSYDTTVQLMIQVNGPRAVVVDLSNENSAHKGMHPLFDEEIHRCNVPGYRVDPKVSSSVSLVIHQVDRSTLTQSDWPVHQLRYLSGLP